MWNMLLVLIVAAVIFMLNPLKFADLKPSPGVDKKTKTEVNQAVNEALNQANQARQYQQQEQESLNN